MVAGLFGLDCDRLSFRIPSPFFRTGIHSSPPMASYDLPPPPATSSFNSAPSGGCGPGCNSCSRPGIPSLSEPQSFVTLPGQ